MENHTDSRHLDDADAVARVDGAGADSDTVVYTRSDGDSPSHSVVEAVADVTGTEPTRLRPLYEVIDTDALDDLIAGDSERPRAPEGLSVTFRFEGCDVAVYGDGRTVASRSPR
ncbi:HalOD1 output domain-containing protein [Halobellus limi]|jgi:hypothetical protein|uniref:Halobacterial output domain-containing protein n=1 Tax=Halobellus limi TaxID=699433 RepID=A0A1H5V113_9EURY|nr:HalOD1 output domain-containing protein [Halobellus limi]SEF80870.1 hypothetical protein SAMN04488133_0803 [Halobellus limi]